MDDNTEEFEGNAAGKSSISADLIRGHINTIILRSLYDRDKYGYEIINEINEKSHGQYTLKQPTLYSALKRLENQGYIQAYWKQDEVSARGQKEVFPPYGQRPRNNRAQPGRMGIFAYCNR